MQFEGDGTITTKKKMENQTLHTRVWREQSRHMMERFTTKPDRW